jgi:hypothetical protein
VDNPGLEGGKLMDCLEYAFNKHLYSTVVIVGHAHPDHDQFAGRNDGDGLPLIAHGEEGISRQLEKHPVRRIRILALIQPKMGTILAFRGSGRRGSAIGDSTF